MTSKQQQAALGELAIASNPAARSAGLHHAAPAVSELAIAGARMEIVFIEDDVPDIDTLIRGFGAGREIVILDASRDGLQQIVDALEGRGGIDALHIVSHGAAGALNLGQLTLDAANLNAHEAALQTIGASLTPGADILLYGCGIGAGAGADFVGQLAIATGADVAASDDLTGGLAAGGDWELEVVHGNIEARVAIDPALAAHYAGVLATGSTVTFDSDANFIERGVEYGPGADESSDVVYQVGGNSEHLLVISGDNENVFSLDKPGASGVDTYAVISLDSTETGASIYFKGGQAFTISDMSGSALQWDMPGYPVDQTLVLTGHTADNRTVTTNWSITSIPYVGGEITPPYPWHAPDDLSEFVNIVRLTITTTDNSGVLKYIAIDELKVSDIHDILTAPEVVSVTSPASNNKAHKAEDTFEISVVFDQAVTVDTTNGTPTLQLATGNPDSKAVFTRAADAKTLVFTYTVLAGDHAIDLAYASTAALSLEGASIKLAGDTLDADLALPTPGAAGSLDANNAIQLDGVAPTLVISHAITDPLKIGATATITFTFSEAVKDFTAADIGVTGSGGTITSLTSNANNTVYTATFTPAAGTDNGTATITVGSNYTDLAGNAGLGYSTMPIAFDTEAPVATVTAVTFSEDTNIPGDFVTREPIQTVSGALTAELASGEWVGVSIDNGVTYTPAVVGAGATWSLAGVELAGKGTLVVRVFDAAGNLGSPFTQAYEYDAVKPDAPSTPDLTTASDSGDDDQDNITGVTTPTFTGTAEAGATVTLYANGTAVGSGQAGLDRSWSITVDDALPGGDYDFTVRASDLAGNVSDDSPVLAVTIITSAPSNKSTSFAMDDDSGTDGDLITNMKSQILSGTLSNVLGIGEKAQVYIGGRWHDTGVLGSDAWSHLADLENGTHDVQVRVVNAIGNSGPVETYTYTLDTTPPTIEITSDNMLLKVGEQATITFSFSDDPGAAFSKDSIVVTGGSLSDIEGSGTTRTATFTPAADENGGEASFSIADGLFRDLAGNVNALSVLNTLRFDTKAPTAPQALALANVSDSGTAGDGITSVKRPVITGDGESGTTVVLYDADDNVIGSGAVVGGKWSITLTRDLAEGENTIGARAFDAAGNASAPATGLDITLDQTPPTVSITSDVDKLKVGETATITFTFSEDPGTSFTADSITVSGGELGALTKNGLTFSAEFTPTANRDATTASITIGAGGYWDAAGNNGGAGTTPTLKFDTKAPPAPSIPDLDAASDTGSSNNDNITGDTTPTFTGTGEEGATVRLYVGEDEIGSGVVVDGAWSITSSTLGKGEHFVTAVATDAMGNAGPSSDALKIEILTDAPTTKATSVKFSADTGALGTDLVTRTAAQTISGELSAELKDGEYVEVSVNGGTTWNVADADADGWSIATTLVAGRQEVVVRVVNAIGNSGDKYPRDYHLDTVAPTLAISSNVAALKSGQTATITFTFSEDPGTSFAWDGTAGGLVVSGGTLSPISGSGTTRTATFTPDDKFEGHASITVNVGSYSDLAGNPGTGDTLTALDIDTLVPDQPGTPALAADSDTGAKGDGRTESTTQVIEGSGAEPGATVYLYNGNVRVGQAQAGAEGQWSIELKLGGGTYTLRVSQFDEAGNESDRSDPFQLTVTTSTPNPDPEPNPNPNPNPQPNPPAVVDGMPVTTTPVTLPGGVSGTTVAVPIVTGGRNETDGQASLADIPLASSGGQAQLLAQLPVGYGLSSSGASVGATSGLAFLIASIKAATPTHAPDDQGHLVQNGTSFLQGLSYSSLLVHTVKPVSNPGTTDALVLTGFNPAGAQGTALVIETVGLANGASIELVDVDFAALVGAATVYTGSNGAILAGDGASQHFTVVAGNNNGVFAGGGSDLLTFAAGAPVDAGSASGRASAQQAAASGTTTLHGGQGGDAASFAGVRGDYDIETHNGYLVVSSKAAPDAKALVVNVEELRFGDGNVAVENGAGLATLAGMYQTVFGRQADLYGFEYWADHRDNGLSWGTIALELIASSERVAQHGDFNGDAANDIGLLYQALFNREAEAEGLAFWKAAMEERGMSLEQVATSFVESAEMVGHQRGALDWDFLV